MTRIKLRRNLEASQQPEATAQPVDTAMTPEGRLELAALDARLREIATRPVLGYGEAVYEDESRIPTGFWVFVAWLLVLLAGYVFCIIKDFQTTSYMLTGAMVVSVCFYVCLPKN